MFAGTLAAKTQKANRLVGFYRQQKMPGPLTSPSRRLGRLRQESAAAGLR
jgi:hypothetical protein